VFASRDGTLLSPSTSDASAFGEVSLSAVTAESLKVKQSITLEYLPKAAALLSIDEKGAVVAATTLIGDRMEVKTMQSLEASFLAKPTFTLVDPSDAGDELLTISSNGTVRKMSKGQLEYPPVILPKDASFSSSSVAGSSTVGKLVITSVQQSDSAEHDLLVLEKSSNEVKSTQSLRLSKITADSGEFQSIRSSKLVSDMDVAGHLLSNAVIEKGTVKDSQIFLPQGRGATGFFLNTFTNIFYAP
jgi:hypothetical protein